MGLLTKQQILGMNPGLLRDPQRRRSWGQIYCTPCISTSFDAFCAFRHFLEVGVPSPVMGGHFRGHVSKLLRAVVCNLILEERGPVVFHFNPNLVH